jgi:hypothetical protein
LEFSWRQLAHEAKLPTDGNAIRLTLADGRRQVVRVDEPEQDFLHVWSVIAGPSKLSRVKELPLELWIRNRLTDLVGLRVDSHGRLIGEAWVPTAGLQANELESYAYAVARACDRLEFLLTGADVE